MALDTLPSSDKLLSGLSLTYAEATVEGGFGGGYEQRTPLGMDNVTYATTLSLAPLTEEEYTTLEAFLLAKGQAIPFLAPRPDEPDLVVLATSWKRRINPLRVDIKVKGRKYPGVTPQ